MGRQGGGGGGGEEHRWKESHTYINVGIIACIKMLNKRNGKGYMYVTEGKKTTLRPYVY